jgi:dihydrofolate reductase/thymidylate synthase
MALCPFSIIVTVDASNGISKKGIQPWNSPDVGKFFRDTTLGKGKNIVIMGRITYEAIPVNNRPLQGRRCVIISRTWKQEDHPEINIYPSLIDALAGVGANINHYDDVYICGGEQLYNEAIKKFMYLCKKIIVTKFKFDYQCDQHFLFDEVKEYPVAADPVKTRDYSRYTFVPKVEHDEYQYLKYLDEIKNFGEAKADRTGTGVRSIFGGVRMVFDLRDRLPIITTKKVSFDMIIKELLFFISGKTDSTVLSKDGVKIWDANTTKKRQEELGLPWDEGDIGPAYGHQWRHFGAEYTGCHEDYTDKGIDQLSQLIQNIRDDPLSRRHILTAWNPAQIGECPLPPCHILAQFNVSGDKRWLDCQVYQRSGDFFLGVPYNLTSYSLLTCMIAHITGLKARKLVHIIGDAHLYNNHIEQAKRQLGRTPRPFPTLSLREATRLHEIDDFTFNSFIIEGYQPWPGISAEMAV